VTLVVVAVAVLCMASVLIWSYAKQQVTPSTEPARSEPVAPVETPSIAVLPFTNMSDDPQQVYFSDGISEGILNGLAKNPGLVVKAPTSSFSEKVKDQDARTIGNLLGVTHFVEGSVQKAGNRIRVTAQLIATSDDAHIWSEQYDRELTGVFEVQDDIANAILEELNVHLLGAYEEQTRTADMEAYNYYLLGRYLHNQQELEKAVDAFSKAIALDPDYANAYGALSLAHNDFIWWCIDSPPNRLPIVYRYVDRALSVDPDQPDALLVRAYVKFMRDRAYQDAINEIAGLVRKYPNSVDMLTFYGNTLQAIGRFDLTARIYDRILELDPLSPRTHLVRGLNFLNAGEYGNARQSFERMEVFGMNEPCFLAWLSIEEGDIQAIQEQLDIGRSEWGYGAIWYPVFEAGILYLKGDVEKAKETLLPLKRRKDYVSYYTKGDIATVEGDFDLSLDYQAKALDAAEYDVFRVVQAPSYFRRFFPEYRTNPKYQRMLRDFRLDRESIAKLKIPPLPF